MIQNFNKIEGNTLQMRINDKVALYKIEEAWTEIDSEGDWEGKASLELVSTYNSLTTAVTPMTINLYLKKYHNEQLYRLNVVDVDTNTYLFAVYLSKTMGIMKSAQEFINYLARIDYTK